MQAKPTSMMYRSAFDCLRKSVASPGGVRTLFTGLKTTLVRDVPGHAVYFVAYDIVSNWLSPDKGEPAPVYAVAAGGSCAGVAFWASIYPLDMVKSRIQTMDLADSFGTLCRQEYRTRGFAGLYRGLGVTLSKALVSNGVIFLSYEYTIRTLDSQF